MHRPLNPTPALILLQLQDKLNYERAIVEAHRQKIAELEQAHAAREVDWHELSTQWKQYEIEAAQENSR